MEYKQLLAVEQASFVNPLEQYRLQPMKFAKLPVCILTVIILICFGRTLGSYFIADDFAQIAYVSGIYKGDWNALFSNFTGNYMQIPVMRIYRPCLLLSLIFDYGLWHTNPFGYFLTDILIMIGSAVMLYLLLREMTKSWGSNRSVLFSLLSAALFASNPLHCESISFVSGRDNVISALFYLLTLWCFVRKGEDKSKRLLTLGVLSFWVAMLSKEMAIGLPVILAGIGFFLPEVFKSKAVAPSAFTPVAKEYSIRERLSLAFRVSMSLWLSTIVYLLIRFLALGTLAGGYTGSLGAGLMSHLTERWTNFDTITKIIFPLNVEVFGAESYYKIALSVLYTVLATLICVKLSNGRYPVRWLGWLVLWTLTTIAPLYQLWGLSDNLGGARFFFFLSIPLAIFVPFLILVPSVKPCLVENTPSVVPKVEAPNIEKLGTSTVIALVMLSTWITYKNNIPWVHAGKQAKACLLEGQKLARSIAPGKKLALIGIPKEEGGAHIIYNGSTFNIMMSPPFSAANYSETFVTFDPLFYGPSELIGAQRLKKVLSDLNVVGLYVWNEKTLTFDQLKVPSREVLIDTQPARPVTFQKTAMLIANCASRGIASSKDYQASMHDYGLLIAPSRLDPYQYDFIEIALKASSPKEPVFVYWRGAGANGMDWCDCRHPAQGIAVHAASTANIRIRLSDHWRWFTQGNITQLRLDFLPNQSIEVKSMRLLSARGLVPKLAVKNVQASNTGIYSVGKEGIRLDFDASAVENCAAVKVEISKPNYLFEGQPEEENEKAVMTTIVQPVQKGHLYIAGKIFVSPGNYQLRAACLNEKGMPVGERSDPCTMAIY